MQIHETTEKVAQEQNIKDLEAMSTQKNTVHEGTG